MAISIFLLQFDVPNLIFICRLFQGYSAGYNWLSIYLVEDYTKTGIVLGFYHFGTILGPFMSPYIKYLAIGDILLMITSLLYTQRRIEIKSVVSLKKDPHLLHATLIFFLQLFMFNGMLPVLSLYLHDLKTPDNEISMYFMIISLPNIVLSIVSGYFTDRYDSRIVIFVGMFWNIGCVVFFFNLPILFGILSISASFGWLLTSVPSLLTSERLPIFIWYNTVIGIAYGTTPLLAFIYKRHHLKGVATTYLLCVIIMIVVHLAYWNVKSKVRKVIV